MPLAGELKRNIKGTPEHERYLAWRRSYQQRRRDEPKLKAAQHAATLDWRRRHPDKVRLYDWRRALKKYGLTVESWTELLIAQSGRCAICSDPMPDPQTDHDHGTGAARGLLCSLCNIGLGRFRDDPTLLRAAADYLED